ncbi:MAG TPA: hypothetical protein VN462_07050 [Negativicutes bacterium]|nr:hypothetical protein [Negativicutes bacterium]
MKRIFVGTPLSFWLVCGVLLIYTGVMWLRTPNLARMWVYPTVRDITKLSVLHKARGLDVRESEHFVIKYKPQDQASVQMVLDTAEEAYEPVTDSIGFKPPRKATIILVSSREEMQQEMGWSSGQSAMGVFWSGLIEVLAPQAWITDGDLDKQKEQFVKNGPMAHEFTHLVVDAATRGNYPRWFTEGLAQYQEYRLNGYEWITSTNSLNQPLYSLAELERDFDGVDNQSLAYRESFAAVRYMYAVYGDDGVRAVLSELNRGKTLPAALQKVCNMNYPQFEAAWQQWARQQMQP